MNDLKKLAIYLINKHHTDVKSANVSPLMAIHFLPVIRIDWNVNG